MIKSRSGRGGGTLPPFLTVDRLTVLQAAADHMGCFRMTMTSKFVFFLCVLSFK